MQYVAVPVITLPSLILSDGLTPKWRFVASTLTRKYAAVVTRYGAATANVMALCERLAPCLLVLEHAAVCKLGDDELRELTGFGRSVKVLVEAGPVDLLETEHLIRLGCSGVIPASAPPGQGCRALLAIHRGELWANRSFMSDFIRRLLRDSRHGLTVREGEILTLLAKGLKNTDGTSAVCTVSSVLTIEPRPPRSPQTPSRPL
jgi:DNA-binding NarL/FixJ family response regulator